MFKTKLNKIEFECKIDMFLMALRIRGTFGFADLEGGGVQIKIHILVVLLIYY